jgi:hypothetical protein
MPVISNTSPLLNLAIIDQLDLITPAIWRDTDTKGCIGRIAGRRNATRF